MSMDDDFIGVDSAEEEINTVENEMEAMEQATPSNRAEWLKFAVFVVVLIVVMGTVWLASPLIFNNIVPAVMGKNLPAEVTEEAGQSTTEGEEETTRGGTQTVEEGVEEVTSEDASSEETDTDATGADDAAAEGEEATDTDASEDAETDEDATDAETAESSEESEFQAIYTVKSGDTLAAIARLYGVPMQSIMDANGITNAALIVIGDELKIPHS